MPVPSSPTASRGYVDEVQASAVPDLSIPGAAPPFTYMVSPWELECVDGYIVPRIVQIPHIPAVGRVTKNGDPSGAISHNVSTKARVEVPRDVEVTAFGQRRRGYAVALKGTAGPYWVPVWKRARMVGSQVHWEEDLEGWRAFQRDLIKLATGGQKLTAEQVEIATRPVLQAISDLRERPDSPRVRAQLEILLKSLPPEHRPADLKPDPKLDQAKE